jgi:BTB/POZ domain
VNFITLIEVDYISDASVYFAYNPHPSSHSFLGAMLVSGFRESGTNIVDIDCDPTLFRYVLDYLYGVSIEVPSSLIVPLLGLASSYSMIGMRDRLADVLGQNLCIENSCAIFAAAGASVYSSV